MQAFHILNIKIGVDFNIFSSKTYSSGNSTTPTLTFLPQ